MFSKPIPDGEYAAKREPVTRVLVIEDNPADVMLIREALARSPKRLQLEIASDAEEAVRLIRTSVFDLVILDLNIPKADGHPFLTECRSHFPAYPPVIVFSGSQNPSDRQKALSLGATEYIAKPHSLGDFIAAVEGIIQTHA